MIPLMKKNASKEEQVAWAKTQAAYEAGFRYVPEAHKEDCTCGREHAIKAEPLTHQDMLDAMAERNKKGDKQ
jgi:hypothetical protein